MYYACSYKFVCVCDMSMNYTLYRDLKVHQVCRDPEEPQEIR